MDKNIDFKKTIFFLEPDQARSFNLKGVCVRQLLPREVCVNFSAYMVCMEPGQVKRPSFHKEGEELYYVVSGSGEAELGNQKFQLKPGCFFRVPPNTVHTFSTQGESLDILNFHSPPVFSDHDTYFVGQE